MILAACGGEGGVSANAGAAGGPAEAVNTGAGIMLSGEWPLTGDKLEGDAPAHPVYVVKMDNTSSSAPQIGLGSADLVVEELVEGGLTRLAVFYYSTIPDAVGPVRSMRASDIGIVSPVAATLVASGGANPTLSRLADAKVSTFIEGATGFYRDDDRSAPYNLFTALRDLADRPETGWQPPAQSYLPFGDADDFSGSIAVSEVTATFSAVQSTQWERTADGWIRQDSFAATDDDFVADNLLLLSVEVEDAGYRDPAGNFVPETRLTGQGEAVLVHAGEAAKAVWSKTDAGSQLELSDADGDAVTVPAGNTWIELVPADDGEVILSK
ncbi:MAG: DUF3048 domain-containing protein [Nocardioidaceae bacterium]